MSWDIPIGWNERGTARLERCAAQIASEVQNTTITVDGTVTVFKFGHWTSRGTNNCQMVDGVIVHPGVGE